MALTMQATKDDSSNKTIVGSLLPLKMTSKVKKFLQRLGMKAGAKKRIPLNIISCIERARRYRVQSPQCIRSCRRVSLGVRNTHCNRIDITSCSSVFVEQALENSRPATTERIENDAILSCPHEMSADKPLWKHREIRTNRMKAMPHASTASKIRVL
jgi:hypothetical protein